MRLNALCVLLHVAGHRDFGVESQHVAPILLGPQRVPRNDGRSAMMGELRERAQKQLGPKFDLRKFHDEMLDGGTLPLDLLEARADKWIAQQKLK